MAFAVFTPFKPAFAETTLFVQGTFEYGAGHNAGEILPGSFIKVNQFNSFEDLFNQSNILSYGINITERQSDFIPAFTYDLFSSGFISAPITGPDEIPRPSLHFIAESVDLEDNIINRELILIDSNELVEFINGVGPGGTYSILGKPIEGTPTETNPIIPIVTPNPITNAPPIFTFIGVPSGGWFDPPVATGYTYNMTSDSLFTEILNFPSGFSSPFTVFANNMILGTFSPGQSILFPNGGVSSFSISGITPPIDTNTSNGFPLQLAFSTPTANFTQTAIISSDPEPPTTIPEPSTLFGLGLLGLGAILRRKA